MISNIFTLKDGTLRRSCSWHKHFQRDFLRSGPATLKSTIRVCNLSSWNAVSWDRNFWKSTKPAITLIIAGFKLNLKLLYNWSIYLSYEYNRQNKHVLSKCITIKSYKKALCSEKFDFKIYLFIEILPSGNKW